MESYHPYLQPQKFSKNPKFIAFIVACPKSLNSIYGTHRPLGVKHTPYNVNSINVLILIL
jgi:hypothetical protein